MSRRPYNPHDYDENGRMTNRAFVKAVLRFIAEKILYRGILLAFMVGVIVLALWSVWFMTWGIVNVCKAF